jgi:signal transduction histidine kinase
MQNWGWILKKLRKTQTGKGETNIERTNRRYFSLQTKLGLSFSILTIVTSALLTFALYQTVRGRLLQDIRQRLYDIVNISALQIDGDAHATLADPTQEGNATYIRIKRVLQNIRDKGTDIRYVYTWRRNPRGQLIFVVDAETDPKEISHLGDVYISAEPSLLAELATLDHTMVDKEFTTDKWGIWLSGYAPFYRSDGQMEGILGVDIAASDVMLHQRRLLWVALGVFGAIIPLASILGWLLGRKLAAPIVKLTAGSERITEGDLNYRVAIQNNDETGELATAFNGMTQALQKTIMDRDQEITNRKETENTLETTVQQLSLANRELEEFAYITAHDLKSPLRAIGGLAGIISNDYADKLDQQGKNYLDMLVQRTERMSMLISGILQYCNLGRITGTKEYVNTDEVVRQAIAKAAPPENVKVSIEGQLPVLIADKEQILQVFENLIGNAVKFMDKPAGIVKIACDEEDDFWKFSVTDNGPGIDEKYHEKIFKIFQTLARRDELETTGIGLSLVRRIVELYNGKVWVESEVGQGSTFFFTLAKEKVMAENVQLQTNIVG